MDYGLKLASAPSYIHMKDSSATENLKSGVIDFIAGLLGGIASVFVGQPLDTVKVKMQIFPHLYKGMYDCLKTTLKNENVRGLYAGTVPAIIANMSENAILFAAYGYCQKFICIITGTQKVEELSILSNASAGFLSAFFSSFALCPTELIKCQLQAMRETNAQNPQTAVHITAWQLTRRIIRQNGIMGMFRGLLPTMVREMPGYFFFFGAYEGVRMLLAKPGQKKDNIGFLKTMVAGAAGGAMLWIMVFPIDVIKSRIQVSDKSNKYYEIVCEIVKKEGFLGFYNGLIPTLARTIPATATLFVVYEYSKKLMHYLCAI
ncbi:mitochondrial ornithine transporter 1-like [Pectinophora gossypiella]|uniref:mitochondrial ornithine transporter 1-like n=1 Tax=Pectinophora gossypiella TaxID=13191 RepID=UPI00214E708B|nr:mitochondrial ornithine transporter 1-like [Pectinophora gossypiella]